MRDKNRIPIILKRLEKLWLKDPDLRLGQLILNKFSFPKDAPLYYIEDDELIEELEKLYDGLNR